MIDNVGKRLDGRRGAVDQVEPGVDPTSAIVGFFFGGSIGLNDNIDDLIIVLLHLRKEVGNWIDLLCCCWLGLWYGRYVSYVSKAS